MLVHIEPHRPWAAELYVRGLIAIPFAPMAVAWLLSLGPAVGGAVLLLACSIGLILWQGRNRQDRVAEDRRVDRRRDSICTFARSFPRRGVDTWVLRAVWTSLATEFPLRTDDALHDWWLDEEDLLLLAERCQRAVDPGEHETALAAMTTVADLVHFLNAQPKLAA